MALLDILISLIVGPVIIVVSLIMDFCKLGDSLMREEDTLEYKY